MHTTVENLFENLWDNYLSVTPSAKRVHQLLETDSRIINDHVAFRTFNIADVNIDKLAQHFIALGYEAAGEYHFEAKKLYARHYQHSNPEFPKVFISELLVDQLSDAAQTIIKRLVSQVSADSVEQEAFLYSGKCWDASYAEYQQLLEESEYAAWMAAYGYRANHFTVSVNHLAQFDSVEAVNDALKDAGFTLNTSGGEVKGGADVFLAQSSTMADKASVAFSDGTHDIPSCFYEFALRYPMANGELYQGFVAASADKIFESTNAS